MDIATILIFILFLFIDLILIYRPIPIVAFPIMLFFFYFAVTEFWNLSNSVIPFNPLTTIFFIMFVALGLLRNAIDFRE